MGLRTTLRRILPTRANRFRREALRDATAVVPPETARRLDEVPGCLSREQGLLLCHLARTAPAAGDIVEIGSFLGKSTLWIAHGAAAAGADVRVVSIDPHDGHERPAIDAPIPDGGDTFSTFQENVARFGFATCVVPLRQRSRDAGRTWNSPIRLLWIDGSHDYADVRDDLALFSPHVVPRGFLALHDTGGRHFPGVRKALEAFLAGTDAFEQVLELRNMAVARRRG